MSYSNRRQKGDYRWVPDEPAIYRLYYGDSIVYVGETNALARRLKEHETETQYWGSYDYKPAPSNTTRRKEQEERAIKYNKPTRNR